MLASKVALHVNLYETEDSILVELMGTSSFSAGANPETDCWPGDATFHTDEARFEIPFEVAGVAWPEWLETSKDMVRLYLRDKGRSELTDEQLLARLAETVAWCDSLKDLHELRSEALSPSLFHDGPEHLLSELGRNRQQQLRHKNVPVNPLIGAADAGIDVNPEACIIWLDDSDVSTRRRVEALTSRARR